MPHSSSHFNNVMHTGVFTGRQALAISNRAYGLQYTVAQPIILMMPGNAELL
jgi:hypothetical protein